MPLKRRRRYLRREAKRSRIRNAVRFRKRSMFTTYEKIILGFNCVFLCIGLLNLTIGLHNMLANRRVEQHAQELKKTVGNKGYPE